MQTNVAVINEKGGRFSFQDLQLDNPRPGEVLVRVIACDMRQTDVHVRDQDYAAPLPAVLGHEGTGVVKAIGSGVTTVEPDDHVVGLLRLHPGDDAAYPAANAQPARAGYLAGVRRR